MTINDVDNYDDDKFDDDGMVTNMMMMMLRMKESGFCILFAHSA